MKVTVLGAGAWGTVLAKLLSEAHHTVTLWGHDARHLEAMASTGRNDAYLAGVTLPTNWRIEPDLPAATQESECVVVAVPSKAFRAVTSALAEYRGILVSVTKGIECSTGLTMCGVLQTVAPTPPPLPFRDRPWRWKWREAFRRRPWQPVSASPRQKSPDRLLSSADFPRLYEQRPFGGGVGWGAQERDRHCGRSGRRARLRQ